MFFILGGQVDDTHDDQLPIGTGNRLPLNAELGGNLRPGGKLASRACLPVLHRAEEQVGGLDPGAGVAAAGADGHHVIWAQVIRPPSPVTCTPQPAAPPVSASTTLSPWGRSAS